METVNGSAWIGWKTANRVAAGSTRVARSAEYVTGDQRMFIQSHRVHTHLSDSEQCSQEIEREKSMQASKTRTRGRCYRDAI